MKIFTFLLKRPFSFLSAGLIITFVILIIMGHNMYLNEKKSRTHLEQQITAENLHFLLRRYNHQLALKSRLIIANKDREKNLNTYHDDTIILNEVLNKAYEYAKYNNLSNIYLRLQAERNLLFEREDYAIKLATSGNREKAEELLYADSYRKDILDFDAASTQLSVAINHHQHVLELLYSNKLYYMMLVNSVSLLMETNNVYWLDCYKRYKKTIENNFRQIEMLDNKIIAKNAGRLKNTYKKYDQQSQAIFSAYSKSDKTQMKHLYGDSNYQNLQDLLFLKITNQLNIADQSGKKKIKLYDKSIIINAIQITITIAMILVVWIIILYIIRYWREKLTEANQALSEANRELDKKIEQRTEKLRLVNENLKNEIKERQEAEKQKHSLQNVLQQNQKLESIGTLAAGIAHDFNNILAVIQAHGDFLKNSTSTENNFHAIDSIINSSHKASELTKQLLTFARKGAHSKTTVDINAVINDAIVMLKPTIPDTITLQTKLDKTIGNISADSNQVTQILINLALNARDAMPEDGTLTFATYLETLDEDSSTSDRKPGNYLIIEVSDTGKGINSEHQEHIFDPFFTTKTVDKGTGLGLSMAYGIMQQHNGTITLSASSKHGTTFKLYFPQ